MTERFYHEAESAAILSHPNIVPVYEIGETEDFLFFTMQLVKGDSLGLILEKIQNHFLTSRRILPIQATIRIIVQVLDALDYAHNEEIIHRDIKPDNILMEKHTKRPLISDFGLAKVLRGDNVDFLIRGTPAYMAPEQILGLKVDGRTDIYGVGVVLFEMLVQELPFLENELTESFLKRKAYDKKGIFLKNPSDLNPNLHKDMDEIILKAIAYDPNDRFATCRDFLNHLETYEKKFFK
jgi:serine/threonine-protein kinase